MNDLSYLIEEWEELPTSYSRSKDLLLVASLDHIKAVVSGDKALSQYTRMIISAVSAHEMYMQSLCE